MNCNQNKIIDIQGHRGCRGLLPENTISAFKKAIELGVHTLELDVAVSKDNLVVVSHEPFISRKTCLDVNGFKIPHKDIDKYNFYQMSFDSIRKFDCGTKQHPRFLKQEKLKATKPALNEVFKVSKSMNQNIKFNIELKSQSNYYGKYIPYPAEFVSLVLNVINENKLLESCFLQSFDIKILEEIKNQESNMQVVLLVDEDEIISKKLKLLSFKPEIISPHFELLTIESVSEYQNNNYKIIPWTVNSIKDMNQMIDFQVDGIITDYPDRLIELLKNTNHIVNKPVA